MKTVGTVVFLDGEETIEYIIICDDTVRVIENINKFKKALEQANKTFIYSIVENLDHFFDRDDESIDGRDH